MGDAARTLGHAPTYVEMLFHSRSEKHTNLIDSRRDRPGFCFLLLLLSDLVETILVVLSSNKAVVLQKRPCALRRPGESSESGTGAHGVGPRARSSSFASISAVASLLLEAESGFLSVKAVKSVP